MLYSPLQSLTAKIDRIFCNDTTEIPIKKRKQRGFVIMRTFQLLLKYFIYNTTYVIKKGSTSKKSLKCDHLISIVDLTIYKSTCK